MKNKKEIGKELKKELEKGYNVERISNWAYDLFNESHGEQSLELNDILQTIFLMDAGPEFVLSKSQLTDLANELIRDDINFSTEIINDIAEIGDDEWLICPKCFDAWESNSSDKIVQCLKCHSFLQNPRYKQIE
ncbi:MAG: hypothetical protein H0W88_04695 [Parachlamydiaceae bacterium]|nr:hypothetical protein [Parachlamydiaceae bacterium]